MAEIRTRSDGEMHFARYAARVIGQLKRLDACCLQSGDSRLKNVWEEYKVQVQVEESVFFNLYEDTIRQLTQRVVAAMPSRLLAALWRLTPEADEYGDGRDPVEAALLSEAVEDELFRRIERIAVNDPLPRGFA
jgi:hypothetical protein